MCLLKSAWKKLPKLPCTTALLATIDAFHALKMKKIIIVEPGSSDGLDIWAVRMKKYFEDNGFKVVNTRRRAF